jgi:hypothetical protein
MNEQPRLELLDQDGEALVTFPLNADVLTEGDDGELKQLSMSGRVTKRGKAVRYRTVSAIGAIVEGDVLESRGGNVPTRGLPMYLAQVDLLPGQEFEGRFQLLTVKDRRTE